MNQLSWLLGQVEGGAAKSLSQQESILWVVVGIIASLVVPIAVKTLKGPNSGLETTEKKSWWHHLCMAIMDYAGRGLSLVGYLIAAIVIGLVIVFMLDMKFSAMRDALLAGFAWESLVNKLFTQARNTSGGGADPKPDPKPDPKLENS
jgi:hypothetical protein